MINYNKLADNWHQLVHGLDILPLTECGIFFGYILSKQIANNQRGNPRNMNKYI